MALMTPRRLLMISGILMLTGAAAHTFGFLAPKTDQGDIALENAMHLFHYPPGMGMSPTKLDVFMVVVFNMSVTFAGFGILNLVLAGARDLPAAILRRVIIVNIVWVAASIAVGAYYQVPPALISGILIEIPLIGALFAGKGNAATEPAKAGGRKRK